MSDFSWWTAALKGNRGPIFDGEPMHGFYRHRQRGKDRRTEGPYEPVAYWQDEATGELRCQVNGRSIDMQRALEMWPYVSRNPITAESYWNFMDTGKWMDGDDHAAAAAKGPEIDPALDPAGSLAAEIAAAKAGMAAYATIDSDEQSAKAQTLRSALTSLSGKATKAYEALNRPLLDEQQRIRKIWFPLRDEAADASDMLRKALGNWEDSKRDAARKAKAEEDRKAAEHAEAVRKADEANQPPPPPPPPPVAPNMPAPSTRIKGASGRTASVTIANIVTDIDLDKCFAKFRSAPELRELFIALADKAMKAGICTAADVGAITEERSVIR